MRVKPDDVTVSVRDEMARQSPQRLGRLTTAGPIDEAGWKALADFGVFHASTDEMRHVDLVAALLEIGRGGLPGPVLEAELAVAAGSAEAAAALRHGQVVTSVLPQPSAGPAVVGWGAHADLVIDQSNGRVLARSPLPAVETALPMGHGMIHAEGGGHDPLAARRWRGAAALAAGLAHAAITMATEHVKMREQFGRTLSSFQAVQFRLAQSVIELDAAELMVIDAARKADAGHPYADMASALAWIYGARAAATAETNTHQVVGALGFTTELGLIHLTYQSAWLRSSLGRTAALRYIGSHRDLTKPEPPSVVLAGTAVERRATGSTHSPEENAGAGRS
jgi:hypothetical protein